jgi:hypothetical protein
MIPREVEVKVKEVQLGPVPSFLASDTICHDGGVLQLCQVTIVGNPHEFLIREPRHSSLKLAGMPTLVYYEKEATITILVQRGGVRISYFVCDGFRDIIIDEDNGIQIPRCTPFLSLSETPHSWVSIYRF